MHQIPVEQNVGDGDGFFVSSTKFVFVQFTLADFFVILLLMHLLLHTLTVASNISFELTVFVDDELVVLYVPSAAPPSTSVVYPVTYDSDGVLNVIIVSLEYTERVLLSY